MKGVCVCMWLWLTAVRMCVFLVSGGTAVQSKVASLAAQCAACYCRVVVRLDQHCSQTGLLSLWALSILTNLLQKMVRLQHRR